MKEEESKTFGLLGKNISYSFSRGYFTEKFEKLKLNKYKYLNFDIQQIKDFPSIIGEEKNVRGIILIWVDR